MNHNEQSNDNSWTLTMNNDYNDNEQWHKCTTICNDVYNENFIVMNC